MRRFLRWVTWTFAAGLLMVLLVASVVYVGSERILRRTYTVELAPITLPVDSSALVEGERLARVRGCFGGCHGERFEGSVFFDGPADRAKEAAALGDFPFTMTVELTLDGVTHVATATYPDDEIRDAGPYVALEFAPPLPR